MGMSETRLESDDRWDDLPRGNPCAQCGQPISRPVWVERSEDRAAYLWECHACGYRFEAIVFYAHCGARGSLSA